MPESQVLVSGGSRGIGAAIALELDRRGYGVVCLSRSGVAPAGLGMACDVTDASAVDRVVAEAAARGPVVGVVNNAGVHVACASVELSADAFEATMRSNATSALNLSRAAHPFLAAAGSSLIVNIGSFFDKLGVARNLAYCASKAAIGAITRCLATEWAAEGIRVMNVAPGYVETDLNAEFLARPSVRELLSRRIPVARAGRAEEVARIVAALFCEDVGFLTGETIYVDGGQGMNH